MFYSITAPGAASPVWLTSQPTGGVGVGGVPWGTCNDHAPRTLVTQSVQKGAGWVNVRPFDFGNVGEEWSFTIAAPVFSSYAQMVLFLAQLQTLVPRAGTVTIMEQDPAAGVPTWNVLTGYNAMLRYEPQLVGQAVLIKYTLTIPSLFQDTSYIPSLQGVGITDGTPNGITDDAPNRLVS